MRDKETELAARRVLNIIVMCCLLRHLSNNPESFNRHFQILSCFHTPNNARHVLSDWIVR